MADKKRFARLFSQVRNRASYEWAGQRRRMTQERLAELLHVPAATVNYWENSGDKRVPTDRKLCVQAIKIMAQGGGLSSLEEANQLLSLAADWLPLDEKDNEEKEIIKLFSKAEAQPQTVNETPAGPAGTVLPEPRFYVERREDQLIKELIKRPGVTLTIKGPRYVGKSSMLMRLEAEASKFKKVVILDFRQFGLGQPESARADSFFYQFCRSLTDELQLEDQIEHYWQPAYSPPQRCTRYMERYLLEQLHQPLLLAMDDVDRLFDTDFCEDFFSMLRGWHDYRGRTSQPLWRQLDLIVVTSTEPYRFIKNPNQSLFNVSVIIDVPDFTADQVAQLNQHYGLPLKPDEVQRLMELVAGHPDLVRRGLEWVANGQGQAMDLFDQATQDHGPFGAHLQRHLIWLLKQPEERAAMIQVIQHHTLAKSSTPILFRLEGAGLVHREKQQIVPRCQLYADYFKERWYE